MIYDMDKSFFRYVFFAFFVLVFMELVLHIFPFNPDFNISPGKYVMI